MSPDQIKEQLSNRFIGILAANKGFVIDKPEVDLGIDYQLKRTYTYVTPLGKTRYNYDGRYLDIQLKATTENSIIDEPLLIKYDLEVKAFNDLVERQTNGTVPLILILFVLPVDTQTWVEIDTNELRLRKNAYWYVPPPGSTPTANQQTTRIEVAKTNRLDIDCFNQLHQLFYP